MNRKLVLGVAFVAVIAIIGGILLQGPTLVVAPQVKFLLKIQTLHKLNLFKSN